jgi:Na+-driven multidrug efflux pump
MWAMLAGAIGVFVPISWAALRFDWGLSGILIGISALMSWRCATNVYRFLRQKWAS